MLSVAHFSVNPLVASYAIHLGSSAYLMGLLTGLFFGVALLMRPVTGPVITKYDKRKLMIIVFIIGGISNIGYALFPNVSAFILFRLIHGVHYALFGALTMTLAGDNLPKEKMASGMGIYGLSGSVGMAIAPTIGMNILSFGTQLKDESFGFTCVFLLAMTICFLGVIPSYFLLSDKKTKEDIRITGKWYKNIISIHAIPISMVMLFIMTGWSLYNVYMIEYAKQLGISGISSFYTVLALVLLVSRPASGWLTDRYGLARVQFPALIIFATSFLIIGSANSLTTILGGAVIAAMGFGSFQPALYSMCILSETPLKRSVASNTLFTGIDFSLFIGPILGSIVYGIYGYATMFKSAAFMIIIAIIILTLLLPAYHRRRNILEAMEIEDVQVGIDGD